MYITEIELSNLRCFQGTHKISLDRGGGTYAGWTVFAGRNGSGKSTLLKAIAAAVAGPLAVRSLEGGVPNWLRERSQWAHVKVRVQSGSEDRLQRTSSARSGKSPDVHSSPPRVDLTLGWGKFGSGAPLFLHRSHPKAKVDQGPWHDSPDGWFLAAYGPHRRLGPVTADIAKVSNDPKLARLINLFREESTLSDAVDWLKEQHARSLDRRPGAAALVSEVRELLNDGLLPDGSVVKGVDSDGLWITRDEVTVALKQVSDGYRTVTALVVDLVQRLHATYGRLPLERGPAGLICPLPGVVLVDEIDAHMHVAWQQKIGVWLTQHFPNLQFLVTSHSPFICQAASPRGIIRLPGPGEHRKIEHLDPRLFHAVVNGGADDAVMSELFGLDHAHSARAEALRQQVAQLELKMLQGTATEKEQQQYLDDRGLLPDGLGELADRKLRMLQSRRAPARKKTPARKPARASKKAAARKRAPASEKARAGRARTR